MRHGGTEELGPREGPFPRKGAEVADGTESLVTGSLCREPQRGAGEREHRDGGVELPRNLKWPLDPGHSYRGPVTVPQPAARGRDWRMRLGCHVPSRHRTR